MGSPLMAAGAVVGAAIGTATAHLLKFDPADTTAGIYGFNATLVGIATFFFFQPGLVSISLLVVGCIAATLLTHLVRRRVPFPTYTAPFIVTTWAVFFLGLAMGAVRPEMSEPIDPSRFPWSIEAVANGVGQVMFQGGVWTGILFLIGIAINDRRHAGWVLAGSIVGMLVAYFHASAAARMLDPESLIERSLYDNIALGLYGYNACLSAVALSLWLRSMFPPLVGMFLSVLLTDLLPLVGVPALTAPFVMATWMVLALDWIEGKVFRDAEVVAP